MAYAVWKSAGILKKRLLDEEMYTLYTEIEMPLIYSLYHMEKEGIQVQREKLKEYGDKLKVGIARLEKEIYEDTGREFNINSPKQLGEILFGEMKLPGGKKTKTGYSTAADVLEKLGGRPSGGAENPGLPPACQVKFHLRGGSGRIYQRGRPHPRQI